MSVLVGLALNPVAVNLTALALLFLTVVGAAVVLAFDRVISSMSA